MNDMQLVILDREETGSSGAKRTRNQGFVPGVLYGKGHDGQPIKVDASGLNRMISRRGSNAIFNADYQAKKRLMMLKEVQTEPVSGSVVHVDLQEIDANQTVTAVVPLVAVGIGQLAGGAILQQVVNEVEVECLPRYLPKVLEFDVAGMEPGQSVQISDIKVDENVRLLAEPSETVATTTEPKAVVEDEEQDEGEAAEEPGVGDTEEE
jgi:large subunit ribosomal protein L25